MPNAARPCSWSLMKTVWPKAVSGWCGCKAGGSSPMHRLALAWTFARRELRGGLAGFRIFFLCIALGTASIAAVESVSDAFLTGLRDQGQVFLGGDVAVGLVHRPATPPEEAFFARHGKVATVTSMRAMAYALKNGRPAERELVELKAVDEHWPLFGAPVFTPNQKL